MELQSLQPPMPALVMSAEEAALVASGAKQLHSMRYRPDGRVRGQRVAIVAAESSMTQQEAVLTAFACEALKQAGQVVASPTIQAVSKLQGYIVATVLVPSFVTHSELRGDPQDAWFSGGYGWRMSDPRVVAPVRAPASVVVLRGLTMLRPELSARLVEVQ